MSEHVLTGPFLDFGASLWSTPGVVQEFPTLLSKGGHQGRRHQNPRLAENSTRCENWDTEYSE
jgi:hypothetical protein